MKLNRLITFFLLFTLSFSVMHEFVLVQFDENQCNVNEFVQEINAPINSGDICDTHFEFHQVYLMPQNYFTLKMADKALSIKRKKENYTSFIPQTIIIPPIA